MQHAQVHTLQDIRTYLTSLSKSLMGQYPLVQLWTLSTATRHGVSIIFGALSMFCSLHLCAGSARMALQVRAALYHPQLGCQICRITPGKATQGFSVGNSPLSGFRYQFHVNCAKILANWVFPRAKGALLPLQNPLEAVLGYRHRSLHPYRTAVE